MAFRRAEKLPWDKLDELAKIDRTEVEESLAEYLGRSKGPVEAHALFKNSLARVRRVDAELGKEFVGRDRGVTAILASFVSGVPAVLLGAPGTAKSAIVRRIAEYCDLRSSHEGGAYFEYLLTDHTMPEELFGAPDLAELQKGKLKRVVDGKMPTAEVAFLDEVFRGGSHILNTLLAVVNERLFHDGSEVRHVPLLAIVGASNVPPVGDDVAAFYDRFPARVWVDSVFDDPTSRAEKVGPDLLAKSMEQDRRKLTIAWSKEAKANQLKAARVACTHDFRAARVLCTLEARPVGGSGRLEEFQIMFMDLRERCHLSDRTFGSLWRFGTALDLVEQRDAGESVREGGEGHVQVFRFAAPNLGEVRHVTEKVEHWLRGRGHTGDD